MWNVLARLRKALSRAPADDDEVLRCVVCGCTETQPCDRPDHRWFVRWAAIDVCSRCA